MLHLASGMVSFIALAAWVFVALVVWIANANEPGLTAATTVSRIVLLAMTGLFFYFVVWPLVRMPRLSQLAAEVENRRDLKELVRAGFEFSNDATVATRYSPELVGEVIRQAVEKISGLKVRFLFLSRKDLALMPLAYGGLLVLLIIAMASPNALVRAGGAIASPRSVAAQAHRANIYAQPGDITVLAGSDVKVTGLDLGESEEEVTFNYTIGADFWKSESIARRDGQEKLVTGELRFDRYEYTFDDVRHTVSYYFQAGEYQSPTYKITVVHEPILTDMKITLTPPAYTGEAPRELVDNGGNVHALEGTSVRVEGRSNNVLKGAWVRFDENTRRKAEFDGRDVAFEFVALKDGHYSVLLEDTMGFDTGDPLQYSVEVFEDHAPSLEVLAPGGDTTLPRNRLIDIGFIASDDYGVRAASILFRRSGEADFRKIVVPLGADRDSKEVAAAYRWDLSDIELFPGNYIEYFVRVSDNNVVTGPGVAKSRMYQITVPTMAQLYERVKEEDSRRTDMMEQAMKDTREFRERLEKITREFIKTEKMEWAQKKDIDHALEKQKAVEEKLNDIRQSLDQTLENLSENQMTSQEIGEKMEEIRELLEQIDSEELRKHMEELRKAVEELKPEDIKKALENLNLDTQEMLQNLERTAELLKRIAQEQKMEELVRKSRDLMDDQKELGEQTSEASEGDEKEMGELSEKQEQLAKDADALRDQMEKFAEMTEQDNRQTSQKMSEMSEEMKSGEGPKESMEKAAEQLSLQQKQEAMEEQEKAMDKMISLFQRMQKAQQGMQQNQGQKLALNFQKYARQALELSKRQEALAEQLQGRNRPADNLADMQALAQDQMSYFRATQKVTDEIVKMAGQTLDMAPELMEALGRALDRMENSVMFLEQNKPFMSTAHANNAVQALNEATIEMLRSSKQCSQGSSSSSGQSMAQQLMQQLIPQQQSIIQQTQEMMQMQAMGEKLRQQRQAELDRLAGQQRSLSEIAEQIQKSMNNNRDVLGRLDRTVEDMEAVTEALMQGNVDQDLINKEQRILSRLLDAQRSIHTRDYEKKRESVTAEDVYSKSLGSGATGAVSQRLREEIRRALQLGAPGEFEDLIRLYFRALAEESSIRSPEKSN